MSVAAQSSRQLAEIIRLERRSFAAKLRIVRAILGWSQTELAREVGLTQRAIHKLEQGATEPRRATIHALERVWRDEGIEFEDLGDGFQVVIRSVVIDKPVHREERRQREGRKALGVTARGAALHG